MEKSTMGNVKIEYVGTPRAHRLVGSPQEVHRQYGLWICSVGSGNHAPPVADPGGTPRYFEFYCVSHMFHGHGFYWTEKSGRLTTIERGQGVMVTPGFVHQYSGWKGYYDEDTICFTGPIADHLRQTGIFRDGVAEIGHARRLSPIIEKALDPSRDAQIMANRELQDLLIDLYFENKSRSFQFGVSRLDKLLEKIRLNPRKEWTVTEMAEFCAISENQLRRNFRERAGLSPKKYLDRSRLRQAAMELVSGDRSVAEVAADFAFDDPFHFSKRFKEVLGMSPTQYREAFAAPRNA